MGGAQDRGGPDDGPKRIAVNRDRYASEPKQEADQRSRSAPQELQQARCGTLSLANRHPCGGVSWAACSARWPACGFPFSHLCRCQPSLTPRGGELEVPMAMALGD